MGASHDILREVVTSERFQQTEIAMVSRCDYPPWAVACMRLFEAAPGVTLADATTYSVQSAIERLYDARVLVANQPHWHTQRQQLLNIVEVGTCGAIKCQDVICRLQEIYYGSKTKHFRQV